MRTARPTGTTGISCGAALVLVMHPVHAIAISSGTAIHSSFLIPVATPSPSMQVAHREFERRHGALVIESGACGGDEGRSLIQLGLVQLDDAAQAGIVPGLRQAYGNIGLVHQPLRYTNLKICISCVGPG